jgi:REP element-mobilizing transposase RayT
MIQKSSKIFHDRQSNRFKFHDYSWPGAYFVTICIQDRNCWLGKIKDQQIILSTVGKMVESEWNRLPQRFSNVQLDAFVIMPNHIHGIIILQGDYFSRKKNVKKQGVGATLVVAHSKNTEREGDHKGRPYNQSNKLGEIVGSFKSITTLRYIQEAKKMKWPAFNKRLWQRNYYDHIIRSEKSLEKLRQYIEYNPLNWQKDRFYWSENSGLDSKMA